MPSEAQSRGQNVICKAKFCFSRRHPEKEPCYIQIALLIASAVSAKCLGYALWVLQMQYLPKHDIIWSWRTSANYAAAAAPFFSVEHIAFASPNSIWVLGFCTVKRTEDFRQGSCVTCSLHSLPSSIREQVFAFTIFALNSFRIDWLQQSILILWELFAQHQNQIRTLLRHSCQICRYLGPRALNSDKSASKTFDSRSLLAEALT